MFRIRIYFFIACAFLISCHSNHPAISFYYWKTSFKLSETEKSVLKQYHVNTLFIRYFDVELNPENQQAVPLSPVKFEEQPDIAHIIPVVYIKNEVMLQKKINLDSLSDHILSFINQINEKNKLQNTEIQIDCDWTLESRDTFMKFMELFRKKSRKTISVTIRLHQVKYHYKTKVPPADYGVLMYYNMGRIEADSLNSIYEKFISDKYISSLKGYPMHLDVALPIFSQGIHIQNKKVFKLISKINIHNFDKDTCYQLETNNKLLVKHSNIKFGYYFKERDEIKIESLSFDQITEMAKDLNKQLKYQPKQIIFFDLDSVNLKKYQDENQSFNKITNCF